MSEATEHALGTATAEYDAAQRRLKALQQECVDAIADALPAHVDAKAKEIALAQGKVTVTLGDDVQEMRDKLHAAAEAIAHHLRTDGDKIKWPDDSWRDEIALAIDRFLARDVSSLVSILSEYGYSVRVGTAQSGYGIGPWALYDSDFKDVGIAIDRMRTAKQELKKATKAHTDAQVNDLWK